MGELPPDLAAFAAECVAAGRYANTEAVVAAGVRMLREFESGRRTLQQSIEEAETEADRDGWLSLSDVMAMINAVGEGKTTGHS